jgi:hypothetical protein
MNQMPMLLFLGARGGVVSGFCTDADFLLTGQHLWV